MLSSLCPISGMKLSDEIKNNPLKLKGKELKVAGIKVRIL